MPPLSAMSSPKFITCPDCRERYDNTRKRRVIDTCGHPRCYGCLVMDNPCVLCAKLPLRPGRSRASTTSAMSSTDKHQKTDKKDENHIDENQGASARKETKLKRETHLGGSHPDLRESGLRKERSSTLPSFRRDSYFRSLYRYEPNGSQDNLNNNEGSSAATLRPRSMPPSYHKSIDNLHEQFWRSVQHVQQTNPKKNSKNEAQTGQEQNNEGHKGHVQNTDARQNNEGQKGQVQNTEAHNNEAHNTPGHNTVSYIAQTAVEIVDCPAPNKVTLPVPGVRPRSQTDLITILREEREKLKRELEIEELQKKALSQTTRTRSHSDLRPAAQQYNDSSRTAEDRAYIVPRPALSNRPQSWSPSNFRRTAISTENSKATSPTTSTDDNDAHSESPRSLMWAPIQGRTTPMSDGSSEISISFSDSSSISSSESDSLRSSVSPSGTQSTSRLPMYGSRPLSQSLGIASPGQSPRQRTISPLANVTYWVTGSKLPKEATAHRGYIETDLDTVMADQRWSSKQACAELAQTN